MNNENLIPLNRRTKKEQREIARKGGIKSGEIRRKRKELREELAIMLNTENEDGETYQERMTFALINKAINGDVKAYETIANMLRESPSTNDFLEKTLTDVFEILRNYENEEYEDE